MTLQLDKYISDYVPDASNVYSFIKGGSLEAGFKKMNSTCALIFDVNRSNKVWMKFFDMHATLAEEALFLKCCI